MRYLQQNSDANIKLSVKDQSGNVIDISQSSIVKSFKITVYTTDTEEADRYVVEDDFSKIADCTLRLQSEDLDKMARGQLMIEAVFKFISSDTSDGYYDLRKVIATNVVLIY